MPYLPEDIIAMTTDGQHVGIQIFCSISTEIYRKVLQNCFCPYRKRLLDYSLLRKLDFVSNRFLLFEIKAGLIMLSMVTLVKAFLISTQNTLKILIILQLSKNA